MILKKKPCKHHFRSLMVENEAVNPSPTSYLVFCRHLCHPPCRESLIFSLLADRSSPRLSWPAFFAVYLRVPMPVLLWDFGLRTSECCPAIYILQACLHLKITLVQSGENECLFHGEKNIMHTHVQRKPIS